MVNTFMIGCRRRSAPTVWPRFSSYVVAVLVAASLALVSVPSQVRAEDTLSGEILDLACYLGRHAKGPSHKRCAQTCAQHGMPLGLLTDDGKVYVLYPKHGKEEAFEAVKTLAGTKARLTGRVDDNHGILGMEVVEAQAAD